MPTYVYAHWIDLPSGWSEGNPPNTSWHAARALGLVDLLPYAQKLPAVLRFPEQMANRGYGNVYGVEICVELKDEALYTDKARWFGYVLDEEDVLKLDGIVRGASGQAQVIREAREQRQKEAEEAAEAARLAEAKRKRDLARAEDAMRRAYQQEYAKRAPKPRDDESWISVYEVVQAPGMDLGNTYRKGPTLAHVGRLGQFESKHGTLPEGWAAGTVLFVGADGQVEARRYLPPSWGYVVTRGEAGLRAPFYHEIQPYLRYGQQIAQEVAAEATTGYQLADNRAQISARMQTTARANPAIAFNPSRLVRPV